KTDLCCSTHFRQGVCLILVPLALVLVRPAFSNPVVIDFEDLKDAPLYGNGGLAVANNYQSLGITFGVPGSPSTYPNAFDYSQSMPGFPHSGNRALELCYGEEFCTLKLQMNFTKAQTHVKVWIGYDGFGNYQLTSQQTLIMRAFNSAGIQVTQSITSI